MNLQTGTVVAETEDLGPERVQHRVDSRSDGSTVPVVQDELGDGGHDED